MGDRCYVQLICRKADAPRFEALGFTLQEDSDQGPGLVEMTDEERNGGLDEDEAPKDIVYTGSSGPGASYGGYEFACDGKDFRQVEVGVNGGYVVDWDEKLNEPGDKSLAAVRLYHDVNERAFELLKAPRAGDEVMWNDPDNGTCSRRGVLADIQLIGEGAARVTFTDGWQSEVLLSELS